MTSEKDQNKLTYKDMKKKRVVEARIARKWIVSIISVLLIILVIGGMSGYRYVSNGLSPVDPENNEIVEVHIPLGSSSEDIAEILHEAELINNELIFRLYVKFQNESGFQAGDYYLAQNMEIDDIIETLKTGRILVDPIYSVTIPEGYTIEQIADRLDEHTPVERDEFIALMQDRDYIASLIPRYPSLLSEEILDEEIRYPLEGYLYAITYPFYSEEVTAEEVVDMMLSETVRQLEPFMDQILSSRFSVHEAITMASLVEREAGGEEDRQMISGVFYNRLDEEMRLETDPTALYALGEHHERVLYEHLEIESPYNTYHVVGLPIGPIANFHQNAMEAALNPTEHDYFFFVASYEGEVYYAETYEEHQENINTYRPSQD